ncbi:hypothetical protein KC19_6G163400 [Ceratodon purpureus]|uniref:Protein kinase domain-containing protein n=1 Tax=Ceratodon purpureus TaxID=3225 RepID=A0A8T0HH57_CERPU|nr:hypothetical protein KC19_6G163400 [Ceratodon purpureus]
MDSSILKSSLRPQFAAAVLLNTAYLLCFVQCSSTGTQFDYPAFPSTTSDFVALGDAHHVPHNHSINLNNFRKGSNGRFMFIKEPVRMRNGESGTVTSFSTSFTFSITQGEGTDRKGTQTQSSGFALTFNSASISEFIGNDSWKGPRTYSFKFFVVEFDTFQNYLFNDPSNNHIGIDLNTLDSTYTYNLCGGVITNCSFPWNDQHYTVWIEYNVASHDLLALWFANGSLADGVAKPDEALFTVPKLYLNNIFDDYMYVGFVSDSGMHGDSHKIMAWKFNSSIVEGMPSSLGPTFTASAIVSVTLIVFTLVSAAWVAIFGSKYWTQGLDHKSNIILNHLTIPYVFKFEELKNATKNFHSSAILGSGAFGVVYKGVLQTPRGSKILAIKSLRHFDSKNGKESFLAEASSISQIRHRNLVQLQGWCYESNHFFLVFDYMSNGSLDEWLFPNRRRNPNHPKYKKFKGVIPWTLRLSILGGIASALEYLHEDWIQCILHRDIKSSNVMLDDNMNAHLGDFGLARLMDHDKLEKTTLVAGTLSYMAPELPYTGKATKESDVYSFGILILEVICGRQPLNFQYDDHINDNIVLLESVWYAREANNILSVVDPKILPLQSQHAIESHLYNHVCQVKACDCNKTNSSTVSLNAMMNIGEKKMMQLLELGLLCCLPNVQSRPSMRTVKQIISQLEETLDISTTLLNLMPCLPIKRPLGRYPLPGFDSQQMHNNNNSLIQRHNTSHHHDMQSRLAIISMGHETP